MGVLAFMSFSFWWIINFCISWHNANVVGRSWADAMASQNTWLKMGVWSGFVMAACGFTWCFLTPLAMLLGAVGLLSQAYVVGAMKLGYIVIILPIIGSGLVIWLDSVTTAWRQRDIGSVGVAAWNTYAQVHNTYSAAVNLGDFVGDVGKLFTGGDSDNKALVLMVMAVVVALGAGLLLTWKIMNDSARKYGAGILEQNKKAL